MDRDSHIWFCRCGVFFVLVSPLFGEDHARHEVGGLIPLAVNQVRIDHATRHALLEQERGQRNKQDFAFPVWVVRTSASTPGLFGAYFKTRVVVFNPTTLNYPVDVTFFDGNGKVETRTIQLNSNTQITWNDFLLEAFGRTGVAGALEFDSWFGPLGGSSDNEFAVTAEVYTDSPNGRYKTVVVNGSLPDYVTGTYRTVNLGVNVNDSERTNVGVFNDSSFSTATVEARVFSSTGQLLETIGFVLPPNAWAQRGVGAAVSNGWVEWVTDTAVHPYVVTVDNRSNDGSLSTPYIYLPPD
jgi:hypothetical protein